LATSPVGERGYLLVESPLRPNENVNGHIEESAQNCRIRHSWIERTFWMELHYPASTTLNHPHVPLKAPL
jgi:hypothetical protein